jgi:hypothetical protein
MSNEVWSAKTYPAVLGSLRLSRRHFIEAATGLAFQRAGAFSAAAQPCGAFDAATGTKPVNLSEILVHPRQPAI